MSDFQVWLMGNDTHFDKQDNKAVSCFIQSIDLIQPYGVVLAGDIMNCSAFCRHDIDKEPKKHWNDSQFEKASKKEYKLTNQFLDNIQSVSSKSKKIWILGNHEKWLLDFIQGDPITRSKIFSLENKLPIEKYKYDLYQPNSIFKLGKLRVLHGIYIGKNHAKKHVDNMSKPVIYGNTHDIETSSKTTLEKQSYMAWSNGCLCDLEQGYLNGKPQNWNHSFAIIYVFPSGNFQVDIKRIHNGKVIVNGKLIRA